MARLVAKLYLARAIRIHSDRIAFFRHEVSAITREQAIIAWEWILYGDWTFKGSNPTLELSDFFPTDRQLEEVKTRLRDRGLRILTAAEHDRELQIRYNAGYSDGYAAACRVNGDKQQALEALGEAINAMEERNGTE